MLSAAPLVSGCCKAHSLPACPGTAAVLSCLALVGMHSHLDLPPTPCGFSSTKYQLPTDWLVMTLRISLHHASRCRLCSVLRACCLLRSP